jgi:hypothetical protein
MPSGIADCPPGRLTCVAGSHSGVHRTVCRLPDFGNTLTNADNLALRIVTKRYRGVPILYAMMFN